MGVFNLSCILLQYTIYHQQLQCFFTVRWNFIVHVFDVNLHRYCCCHYRHIGPHPDFKYYIVNGKPLCQWLCLSVRNFVRLYLFFPIVFAWDITMHWQERLIFTRALRGKTFWGYVKYIFSVTRYAIVEVLTVYQIFTILSWLQCNLLELLCMTTEKGHLTTKNS